MANPVRVLDPTPPPPPRAPPQIFVISKDSFLVTVPEGGNIMEVKDFALNYDEAYEVEWKQMTWRRPGDPPRPTPEPAKKPETKAAPKPAARKTRKQRKAEKEAAEMKAAEEEPPLLLPGGSGDL